MKKNRSVPFLRVIKIPPPLMLISNARVLFWDQKSSDFHDRNSLPQSLQTAPEKRRNGRHPTPYRKLNEWQTPKTTMKIQMHPPCLNGDALLLMVMFYCDSLVFRLGNTNFSQNSRLFFSNLPRVEVGGVQTPPVTVFRNASNQLLSNCFFFKWNDEQKKCQKKTCFHQIMPFLGFFVGKNLF